MRNRNRAVFTDLDIALISRLNSNPQLVVMSFSVGLGLGQVIIVRKHNLVIIRINVDHSVVLILQFKGSVNLVSQITRVIWDRIDPLVDAHVRHL